MKSYEVILSIVLGILSLYVYIRYINIFLKPKEYCPISIKGISIVSVVLNWVVYYFIPIQCVITCSAFLLILSVAILNYKGNMLGKILAVGLTMTLGVVAEGIVCTLFVWISGEKISETLGGFIANLLLLILVVTLERFLRFDKETRLSWGSYLNMIIIPVGSMFLAQILINTYGLPDQIVFWGLCIICVLNIGTYYMYEKLQKAYIEKKTKAVLEKQIAMYQNQFQIIHAVGKDIKQLRHDMKNHILLLDSYLEKEKYIEAQNYIRQLTEKVALAKEYVSTGNDELDSILNYQLGRAEKLHCKVDVKIEVPKEQLISDFDLNMLLSNLMDNALEAVQNMDKRVLTIRIKYSKKVLYISVYNSYHGDVKKNGNQFLTTKVEKEGHGIGMTCIQSIVEKYQGEIKIQLPDDMFKVDILLYV